MLQSSTRTRRNNQSGERLDKQQKNSRKERASTNAVGTASLSGNNSSASDPTKRFASEEEIRRRASGDKTVKTMHSFEASRKDNSANSSRSRSCSLAQTIPSHTTKVLATNSYKNDNESHLSMSNLSEENGIGSPQAQVTEGSHVLNQDKRAIGNPLPRLLRETESSVQRVQLHPLL